MNRIELVALFTSIKSHIKKNDMESIEAIVDAVLDEARYVKSKQKDTASIEE